MEMRAGGGDVDGGEGSQVWDETARITARITVRITVCSTK